MSVDATISVEAYGLGVQWWSVRAATALAGFPVLAEVSIDDADADADLLSAVRVALGEARLEVTGTRQRQVGRVALVAERAGEAAVTVEVAYRTSVLVTAAAAELEGEGGARALAEAVAAAIPRRPEPKDEELIDIKFWRRTSCGVREHERRLRCPALETILPNYPAPVAAELRRLVGLARPEEVGKVILWHGPPGTGKTYAVRALARDWAARLGARIEVILDAEAMFAHADAFHDILLDEDYGDWEGEEPRRLRLIIVEDGAELFADDCRRTPGFARLLNLTDGLIGQGLRVVFLFTANEALGRIDPALLRAGRCLSCLEMPALTAAEADAWLAEKGLPAEGEPRVLAELFTRGEAAAPQGQAG